MVYHLQIVTHLEAEQNLVLTVYGFGLLDKQNQRIGKVFGVLALKRPFLKSYRGSLTPIAINSIINFHGN